MEWWGYGIVTFSLLSSGLAWAARLLWSKEFAAAKGETIRAKDAQTATLGLDHGVGQPSSRCLR